MTRDDARKRWASSGLRYRDLTNARLGRLREMIDAEMQSSGLIDGTYRAGRAKLWVSMGDIVADIRCRSRYFKDRQAVTFERPSLTYPDGFIGFAGWADDANVQPILTAFTVWVDELRN